MRKEKKMLREKSIFSKVLKVTRIKFIKKLIVLAHNIISLSLSWQ